MKPNKEVVEILLKKGELNLSEIVGETGLKIAHFGVSQYIISAENLSKLESVFFTLDFLDKNKLIKITEKEGMAVPDDGGFEMGRCGLTINCPQKEVKDKLAFIKKTKFFQKKWDEFNRKIEIEMSLSNFEKNNCKTDQQIRDFRNVWIPIFVAILAAFFTAFFTSFLDCFSCLL